MMYGYDMFGGMGWFGMVMMLIVWASVIALVIWGLSSRFPRERGTTEPDASEIVRRRYARGEISREEFLQATETLRAPTHPVNPRPLN
jgi:putative membrane protein